MAAFKSGETRLLVATTVIEVGVDVPDATIMVIEHAERFGLAQLHQLRGRVGRGAAARPASCSTRRRWARRARGARRIMRDTEDGFLIAEEDLRLRGEGEVLGTRQSGTPGFRVARIERHADLLEMARDDARLLLARDPELARRTRRGAADCCSISSAETRRCACCAPADTASFSSPAPKMPSATRSPARPAPLRQAPWSWRGIPASTRPAEIEAWRRPRRLMFERNDVLFRHEDRYPVVDVGGDRAEHGDRLAFALGDSASLISLSASGGDEDQRPDALARIFDQPDLAEQSSRLCEHGLEDLLQAAVDIAHQRHPAQQRSPRPTMRAADDVGGEEADQRHQDQRDHQAEAGHRERQIGVRIVARRNIGLDPGIDPVDNDPGEIGGDRERRADDHPVRK